MKDRGKATWGVVAKGRAWATALTEPEVLGQDRSLGPGELRVATQAMKEEGG